MSDCVGDGAEFPVVPCGVRSMQFASLALAREYQATERGLWPKVHEQSYR